MIATHLRNEPRSKRTQDGLDCSAPNLSSRGWHMCRLLGGDARSTAIRDVPVFEVTHISRNGYSLRCPGS